MFTDESREEFRAFVFKVANDCGVNPQELVLALKQLWSENGPTLPEMALAPKMEQAIRQIHKSLFPEESALIESE